MLAFVAEVRAGSAQPDAVVDFEPAIKARRVLLHCLSRDLGLTSVSRVENAGEKLVRVSRAAEAPADERGSLGGEEELSPSVLRARQLQRAFRRCDA
jgi:hypothetical protein